MSYWLKWLKKHIQSCVKTPPAVARENSYGYSCLWNKTRRHVLLCHFKTTNLRSTTPWSHAKYLILCHQNQTLKASSFCSKKSYNLSKNTQSSLWKFTCFTQRLRIVKKLKWQKHMTDIQSNVRNTSHGGQGCSYYGYSCCGTKPLDQCHSKTTNCQSTNKGPWYPSSQSPFCFLFLSTSRKLPLST